jgi:hypothetical protein
MTLGRTPGVLPAAADASATSASVPQMFRSDLASRRRIHGVAIKRLKPVVWSM